MNFEAFKQQLAIWRSYAEEHGIASGQIEGPLDRLCAKFRLEVPPQFFWNRKTFALVGIIWWGIPYTLLMALFMNRSDTLSTHFAVGLTGGAVFGFLRGEIIRRLRLKYRLTNWQAFCESMHGFNS